MISSRRDPRQASVAFQVPPPPKTRDGSTYNRFIPREELQGFASWQPAAFGAPGNGAAAAEVMPGRSRAAEPSAGGGARPADADALATSAAAQRAVLRAELQAEISGALAAEAASTRAAEVAAARTQGYQDGYRDGLAALDSFKESYASQTSAQMGQVLASLDRELNGLEQAIAQRVAAVATQLARQVVRCELLSQPALVARVAQEAVNAVLMSASHITVQVHPDDLPLVATGCAEALAARGARLLALPSLARGGCRVESDAGVIDARIAERWQQATAALGSAVAWEVAVEPPSVRNAAATEPARNIEGAR